MQFHVRLIDDPGAADKRAAHRPDPWVYFDDHRDHFIARGATATDDLARTLSSVIFVEFDTWDAVHSSPPSRSTAPASTARSSSGAGAAA